MPSDRSAPFWRRIVAGVLDFLMVFAGGGYAIASLTGDTTEGGFELSGLPAALLFALIAVYFIALGRYGGGTIWQRILRTRG